LEYIRSLNEFDRRIMLGWKPKPHAMPRANEEEVDRRNRAAAARLAAMMGDRKGRTHG
jgi:hypothetical protein